jgi:predicted DNA-binding transcriptional regulator AlpA
VFDPSSFCTYRDVAALLRVSEASVRAYVKKKHLPEPQRFSQNFVAWERSAVLPHLKRIAESAWFQQHQRHAADEIRRTLESPDS